MADDSSAPEKLKQLDARLAYLESVARDTVARIYEIEKQMGLVFRAVPRELKSPSEKPESPAARLNAVEDALKTATVPKLPTEQLKPVNQTAVAQDLDREAQSSTTAPPSRPQS